MESTQDYKRATEAAEKELAGILERLKDYETLVERRSQLENFIAQGRILLGEEKVIAPQAGVVGLTGFAPEVTLEGVTEIPVAEGALQIFREFQKPLHLKQIEEEFRKRKWRLSQKNGMEIIRFALNRHPDKFQKIKPGTYRLKLQAA